MGECVKTIDSSFVATNVIHKDGSYIIFLSGNKYVLWNTDKAFKEGHTHLKSLKVAQSIIKDCKGGKKPNTNNMYILSSHMRVSNDIAYISYIDNLMRVKKDKGKKVVIKNVKKIKR